MTAEKPGDRPLRSPTFSGFIGWTPLVLLVTASFVCFPYVPGWVFLLLFGQAFFWGFKWLTMCRAFPQAGEHQLRKCLLYLMWPGMNAHAFFHAPRTAVAPPLRAWLTPLLNMVIGSAILWGLARQLPVDWAVARGWVGFSAMYFTIYFGFYMAATLLVQACGIDADPVMVSPWEARSLSEFWGQRWNQAFRDLTHEFVFDPLSVRGWSINTCLFAGFTFSAVVHEILVSLPARGGFGGPTVFFALQWVGVTFDRHWSGGRLGVAGRVLRQLRALLFLVGAILLLFHPPFMERVIVPSMHFLRAL